jgi:photosystem II stability/assembly factor-like uncharacterized protein
MIYGPYALAHHPHDVIDALAVSPAYSEDKTVYIASSEHLYKSGNGGHSWKELTNGLDHSQPISSIAFDPSKNDSSMLFISTLGNGIYRSANGGISWESVNVGLQNLEINEISARSSGVVLAIDTTGQPYISNNNGESWHPATYPQGTVITSLSPVTQSPETRILAGDSIGRILVSIDDGSTWETIGQLPINTSITVTAFDPSDISGSSYFIGTSKKGLYKTADNGKSFQPIDNGLPASHIVSLALSPSFIKDRTIFATTWYEAIFKSSDGGDTWIKYDAGLSTDEQADTEKYRSPHFRQVKIVTNGNQTMFLAGFDGLFKSTDDGRNWREMETLPVSQIKGLAVSPANNDTYSVAISTYGGGAYISHDQGMSWIIANKGLDNPRLGDIKFTPSYLNDRTLFSGSARLLLKSVDNGASWEKIPLGYRTLRSRIIRKLIALGLSKDVGLKYLTKSERWPVYPSVITPSPDYANDKTVLFGTRWHGLYRSEDGGHNSYNIWEHSEGVISTLAVSPNFSKDKTVFLYVRGDGIYKSSDRGDSWRRIIDGLPFDTSNPADVNKQIEHNDFAIVFSPEYSKDQTLFAAGSLGLFKSTDQGESWREVEDSTLGASPNILAMSISPSYSIDHTLLISLKGHGLYMSIDSAQSFFDVGKSLIRNNHSIELLAFYSGLSQNNTIYAASDEALFRSTDAGDSWTLLQRPVRYEDRRDVIHYDGSWAQVERSEFSASTVHYSETKGAKATLDFFGCGIRWIATKSPQGGTANVFIDNSFIESVDLHSEQFKPVSDVFTRTGLSCQPHTITITVGEGKNRDPSVQRVSLDAFDVLPLD